MGMLAVRVEPRSSKSGRGDWIRTSDPLRPRQVRYQAALRPDSEEPRFYLGFPQFASSRASLSWRKLSQNSDSLSQNIPDSSFPPVPNPRRLDTISLRRLYVLLFTRITTRRVHFARCTANPDDCWSRNQARQQRGRSLSARNQFVYRSAITIAN